jgi:hypothetical protein
MSRSIAALTSNRIYITLGITGSLQNPKSVAGIGQQPRLRYMHAWLATLMYSVRKTGAIV